jgi:hypothetical protein
MDRRIVCEIHAPYERGAGKNFELEIALQTNRAGQILPRRDKNLAPATLGACIDRSRDGPRAERVALAHRSKIEYVYDMATGNGAGCRMRSSRTARRREQRFGDGPRRQNH